jgi:alanyl-tRNA synthetase
VPGANPIVTEPDIMTEVYPTAAVEQLDKYSYELCGGTHLERTSDVGAFLIVSEGSAAAGVRRIEAVTGRGAYELIARRFRALKQTAAVLKSSIEEVPEKAEALLDEAAELRKEVMALKANQALTAFNAQLSAVKMIRDVNVLVADVPNANVDTLRKLADKFREKYSKNGAAVLAAGTTVLAVLTEDVVQRGMKAADLITAIGGRGGGRPNMAQGSLPGDAMPANASEQVMKALQEKMN